MDNTKAYTSMFFSVTSCFWLRSSVNYQYIHNTTITNTFKNMYYKGGFIRFYRGYLPAIIQAPVIRTFDLYINNLIKIDNNLFAKSFITSIFSGGFRCLILPIDVVKTHYQINGNLLSLKESFKKTGLPVLYKGVIPLYLSNFFGVFPWFLTYNILDNKFSKYENNIVKNGIIGLCCSTSSDICVNSLKVLKVQKQINSQKEYMDIIKDMVYKENIITLFKRGLLLRIIGNGIQNTIFMIMYKS